MTKLCQSFVKAGNSSPVPAICALPNIVSETIFHFDRTVLVIALQAWLECAVLSSFWRQHPAFPP
ncbi:MAG: hypothetical protein PSV26_21820 [Polaromonas sp.]|uniref:hypothetical protein n=1 Tax=Polaromonas sp. TaxID=1869339 RepID=UPI0024880840|nr:hypothetical protein [Polaromonas sp.]MDI1240128.1 hypothetical protein [Polaromonas sp.]MDI1338665.1 hypothetical protein [Polaromonas sp.]